MNKSILKHVQVLEHEILDLDNLQEGQKTYTDVNKAAVDGGYEGIMIKDLDAPMNVKILLHG